jgi:hypothetical protein
MGGFVENNEPLFFTTFICLSKSWKKTDQTKKLWREGEVYLALPPPLGVIIIIDNQPSLKVHSQ